MVEFAATGSKIYFNGRIVPEREATVHVLSGAVKYGATVFEGICAYLGDEGRLTVFRLPEHLLRLQDSMRIMRFEQDWSVSHLTEVVTDVIKANDSRQVAIGDDGYPEYSLAEAGAVQLGIDDRRAL